MAEREILSAVRREIDRVRSTSSAAVIPALSAIENALAKLEERLSALEDRSSVAAEVRALERDQREESPVGAASAPVLPEPPAKPIARAHRPARPS